LNERERSEPAEGGGGRPPETKRSYASGVILGIVRGKTLSLVCAAALPLVAACGRDFVPVPRVERASVAAEVSTTVARDRASAPSVERERCSSRLAALLREPALPGNPDVEGRRAETFVRAKASGVLFTRQPVQRPLGVAAAALWRAIDGAEQPVQALYDLYPKLQKQRAVAREALLTEGYVYSKNPAFASALSALIKPEDLFDEPEILVQRGGDVLRARRAEDKPVPGIRKTGFHYEYDGGERVKLLLFDRVGLRQAEFDEPLHRDVNAARRALGFEEMRVLHLSQRALSAELHYGPLKTQALFSSAGARLSFECEVTEPGQEAAVATTRELLLRKERALDRLRVVMDEQVREALPFDEPKTEVGQQDGKLRQHWVWAYRYGATQFDFNEDKYRVFDSTGRPRVPQVCIDFITDTFERAGGSWYRGRGEPRERIPGRFDFRALGIDNERSVESFIDFAKSHPEWFEVLELPEKERVPYAHRADFFAHLARNKADYRPGDVVAILGLRDDGKMHYHSFFVYSSDPVTGVPSLVAANAGRPRIRPWESEMLTAPQRSILARIRPRLEWLEALTSAPPDAALSPPAENALPVDAKPPASPTTI
jgi:hypothetical protein